MKQYQKPSIKAKKVIDRGKRSRTIRKVKPFQNIHKNLQSFLEISLVHKDTSFLHMNHKTMHMSSRILSI